MGQIPIVNGKYGTKGLSALLIALAMLVVATAGTVTAETASDVQALENELVTLEVAQEIEADYLLSDALLTDYEIDDNLSTGDIEPIDDDGGNIVVFVWTNGEDAIIVVVLIQDDGSYEILNIVRMSVEDARERLSNFDGRIIVRHFGNSDVDPACPHGYLAARWSIDQTSDTVVGQFKGVWMNADGVVGGNITGQFTDGQFRGMATNLDGDVIGTMHGGYANGHYRGVWELSDGSASGILKGMYEATSPGQGMMKGKWMQNCADDGPDIEPVPVDPIHIKCKQLTTDADSADVSTDAVKPRCKVKPLPLPDQVKPKPKPLPIDPTAVEEDASGLDAVKKSAADLLETELVEMDGGVTIDVGTAAAGGLISSIPMVGLGLLRRRFLL